MKSYPLVSLTCALLAGAAPAVELTLSTDPPGPVEVGAELTVRLAVAAWNPADPQVDAVAFNVDFDLGLFEFVSGSGTTVADGSEFLALPSQAGGYNLGADSSEALVGFGRYIFGAADTGDGTAGSVGPDGQLGSFRLRAVAPGTGTIKASSNMADKVFSDPGLYGIVPTGGVGLGSVDVETVPAAVTYPRWAAALPFASEDEAVPGADPDGDQRCNALEYFLGADPLHPDPERSPSAGTDGDRLTLTYERPAGADRRSDATDFGERSTDLHEWRRDGVSVAGVGPVDPATGRETVVLRSATALGDLPREFLRLAVQLEP